MKDLTGSYAGGLYGLALLEPDRRGGLRASSCTSRTRYVRARNWPEHAQAPCEPALHAGRGYPGVAFGNASGTAACGD